MHDVVADTAVDASTRATFDGGHGNVTNQHPPVPENGNVAPVTTSATSGVNGPESVGAKVSRQPSVALRLCKATPSGGQAATARPPDVAPLRAFS
jgi:hypothetical protein